jgi:quinol monooxygenase YgiN
MIHEIARITIDPARAAAFEAAVAECAPLFRAAHGCRAMRLEREIEEPARYLLRVQWDSVEDHMVHFRESADFQIWRAKAGPFFAEPPVVFHSETVGDPF